MVCKKIKSWKDWNDEEKDRKPKRARIANLYVMPYIKLALLMYNKYKTNYFKNISK